ncbi:transporter, major facilitator family protein [Besnoitia besnoiti]|uniref:Transporter, major facilitator family protein n=1 Tax=Besnoitia besnoiti TaxID=94643 RepID=A0A2A9MCY9_BESBE|nr:transporter, major facilitator family protein [Besnoitia besnoiti]PFH33260.1 transporter, major facilitator family protein [Besnoitia besnoiti]
MGTSRVALSLPPQPASSLPSALPAYASSAAAFAAAEYYPSARSDKCEARKSATHLVLYPSASPVIAPKATTLAPVSLQATHDAGAGDFARDCFSEAKYDPSSHATPFYAVPRHPVGESSTPAMSQPVVTDARRATMLQQHAALSHHAATRLPADSAASAHSPQTAEPGFYSTATPPPPCCPPTPESGFYAHCEGSSAAAGAMFKSGQSSACFARNAQTTTAASAPSNSLPSSRRNSGSWAPLSFPQHLVRVVPQPAGYQPLPTGYSMPVQPYSPSCAYAPLQGEPMAAGEGARPAFYSAPAPACPFAHAKESQSASAASGVRGLPRGSGAAAEEPRRSLFSTSSAGDNSQQLTALLQGDSERTQRTALGARRAAGDSLSPSAGTVGYLPLVCMLFMSIMCNFDHGVIPAVLGDIQEHFTQMGFVEQSLLGSLVYFGLIVGTLFAGVSYQHLGAKWLLVASLTCLSACLYLFASSSSLAVMYVMRFCIGLCQALPVVYIPVWVDAFAPEGQVTRWMAFTQLGGIGGTVLGYFLGGVLSRFHGANIFGLAATSWRTPFTIQAIALLPLLCALTCLSAKTVNLPPSSYAHPDPEREAGLSSIAEVDPEAGEGSSPVQSIWRVLEASLKGVRSLLKNPLYVIITLGMSTLYFVVTGIQFWVTEYMIVVLKFNKITVVVLSTLCFLTAPTSGVWCGGYVCDLCGGYRGGQQRTAVRVATVFAGVAALLAVACVYVVNIALFAFLLWGSLFFGAALVPVAVGMLLSSVPVHQRSLSSAVSQFAYHVFGWFAAPLASGAVMDIVDTWQMHHAAFQASKELPLAVGFSMILCVSVLGFGFFATANLLTLPSEKIEKEEVELQLARSRLPTLSF